MNLFNKIKWVLAITGVFFLILATNLIDKNAFARIEETVDNVYNDRLLAKEVLLDIAVKFHEKELAYSLNDSAYLNNKNDDINAEISKSLEMFDRIESTRNEDLILNRLNRNHAELIQLESNLLSNDTLYTQQCAEIFSAINKNIVELGAEQVAEGERQKFIAKTAIDSVNLYSQMEIYVLIFLGLLLQFVILYKPRKHRKNDVG